MFATASSISSSMTGSNCSSDLMVVLLRDPGEGCCEELGVCRTYSADSALTRARFAGGDEDLSAVELNAEPEIETLLESGTLAVMDLRLLLLSVVEQKDSTAMAIARDLEGISRASTS